MIAALGHHSSLAVRNLRFDLKARQDYRRMVLQTLEKIKRIRNPYRRSVALQKLQKFVDAHNFMYENQPTEAQVRQQDRRSRFSNFHTE